MTDEPTDRKPSAPESEEPPPFDPDPDLITHLERGDKPTEAEVREILRRARR